MDVVDQYDVEKMVSDMLRYREESKMRIPPPPMEEMHMDMERSTMNDCLDELPLAMAFVPMQRWGALYEPEVALHRGTLFPDLDKPFLGEV